MKKITKSFIVFLVGLLCGYYICINNDLKIFDTTYKAFQVGVYTSLDAANTYKTKYKDAIVVKDNELYRVYVSILKDKDNINNMSNYLSKNDVDFYLKDISISNNNLKHKIKEYESVMNNENEVVFLELNKMIINECEELL